MCHYSLERSKMKHHDSGNNCKLFSEINVITVYIISIVAIEKGYPDFNSFLSY